MEETVAVQLKEYREGLFDLGSEEKYRGSRVIDICEKVCHTVIEQVRAGSIKESRFEASFGRNPGAPIEPIEVKLDNETVYIEGEPVPAPAWQAGSWYEKPFGTPEQSRWEAMYGRTAEEALPPQKGRFTMDDTVLEMMETSFAMKCLYRCIERVVSRAFGGKRDYSIPEFRMLMASSADSPLRSIQMSTGLKGKLFKGLLDMANGHLFKGILHMCGIEK